MAVNARAFTDTSLVRGERQSPVGRRYMPEAPAAAVPLNLPELSQNAGEEISRDSFAYLFQPSDADNTVVELGVEFKLPSLSHVTCPVITCMDALALFETSLQQTLGLKGGFEYRMNASEDILVYSAQDVVRLNGVKNISSAATPVALLRGKIVPPRPEALPKEQSADPIAEVVSQAAPVDAEMESEVESTSTPDRIALQTYAEHLYQSGPVPYARKKVMNWLAAHEAVGCTVLFANGEELLLSTDGVVGAIEAIVGKNNSRAAVMTRQGETEDTEFLLVGRFPNKFLRISTQPNIEESVVVLPLNIEAYAAQYKEKFEKYSGIDGIELLAQETVTKRYETAKETYSGSDETGYEAIQHAYDDALFHIADVEDDQHVDQRDFYVTFLHIDKNSYPWESLPTNKWIKLRERVIQKAREQAKSMFIADVQALLKTQVISTWGGPLDEAEIALLEECMPEPKESMFIGSTEYENLFTGVYARFIEQFDLMRVAGASDQLVQLEKMIENKKHVSEHERTLSLRKDAEGLARYIHKASVDSESVSFFMELCLELEESASAKLISLTPAEILKVRECIVEYCTQTQGFYVAGGYVQYPSKLLRPENAFARVFVDNEDPAEIQSQLKILVESAYKLPVTEATVTSVFETTGKRKHILQLEEYLRKNKHVTDEIDEDDFLEYELKARAQRQRTYGAKKQEFLEALLVVQKAQRKQVVSRYEKTASEQRELNTKTMDILGQEFETQVASPALLDTCRTIALQRLEQVETHQVDANAALLPLKKMLSLHCEILDVPSKATASTEGNEVKVDATIAELTTMFNRYSFLS